jgi:hypothetical protein
MSRPFESKETDQRFEKFSDLLLEAMWASRRVAEYDERLGARVYGLYLEVSLEMLKILRVKQTRFQTD